MAVQENELKELRKSASSLLMLENDRIIKAIIEDTPAMSLDEACEFGGKLAKEAGVTLDDINDCIRQYRAVKHACSD